MGGCETDPGLLFPALSPAFSRARSSPVGRKREIKFLEWESDKGKGFSDISHIIPMFILGRAAYRAGKCVFGAYVFWVGIGWADFVGAAARGADMVKI